MKKLALLTSALVSLLYLPTTHAQTQASAGTCLAVANDFNAPITVTVLSTNGILPMGTMNGMQTHANGLYDDPWIIQPGGTPQMLVVNFFNEIGGYVKSQNGSFSIIAGDITPSTNSNESIEIGPIPQYKNKITWIFHPEMTASGNCNGTLVAAIGR